MTPWTSEPTRPVRRDFREADLRSPLFLPSMVRRQKYGPPVYTRREKAMAHIDGVALKNGITRHEIMGRDKRKEYSWPRQEAYFVIREKMRISYPAIGKIMGRDHATVLFGVRAHERRMNVL